MNKINIVKIINEEIKKFDFLGNDEHLKEQETNELLMNEDLQKQFICDSLLNKKNKIKITSIQDSYINGNWDENNFDNANYLSLEYSLNIKYLYDSEKKPIEFNLYFQADKINISVDGWYDRGKFGGTPDTDYPSDGESWYNSFDWNDINVKIYTMDNEEVQFIAFNNAPPRIQILFIREYVQNFIENETLELKTPEINDKVQNTGYC